MKNILAVTALVMAVAPAAMASKARVDSLGNSRHIVDFQTAFDRPYQFMALSTQATIEWGANGDRAYDAANNEYADAGYRGEAGFLMKNDDMAWGVYFGRRSDAFTSVVTGIQDGLANAGAPQGAAGSLLMLEQNPLNVFYASKMGDWAWGVTAKYSNGKDDANDSKASSAGLALAASNGVFDIDLVQGLLGKSEAGTVEVESKGMTSLTVGYHMNETQEVYANYSMIKADLTAGGATTTAVEANTYEVGFVHQLAKTEEMNFFYGVAYKGGKTEKNDGATETKISALPVWMGVEAKATENLTVRGSISQNVILNTVDVDGDKADVDSLAINAGLGYKLGKGMLDASLTSVREGTIGFQDDLLSQVSYTFNF